MLTPTMTILIAYPPNTHRAISRLFSLELPQDSTVSDAVAAFLNAAPSDFNAKTPTSTPWIHAMDGKEVIGSTPLKPFDRIDFLLPIARDPKESRRRRAARGDAQK
ncbi:MAG: RnfH family protein [Burkholderiales bacterium]|nr:RnfH family protein [Burkholderiales bacterium]